LPVIAGSYRLAPELFTRGFRGGCGPHLCSSACCRAQGAYVDLRERDRVLAHAELIKPHLDPHQDPDPARWFESEEKLDPDFPSGACVGTTAHADGSCTFLDHRGHCSLQVAAIANGMHKWALKPTYCALFPLDLSAGTIKLDGRTRHGACCELSPDFERSAFEVCREELSLLLGPEALAELEAELAPSEDPRSAAEPRAAQQGSKSSSP
jgi:hypothetical protein